jgi:hypothetical protein
MFDAAVNRNLVQEVDFQPAKQAEEVSVWLRTRRHAVVESKIAMLAAPRLIAALGYAFVTTTVSSGSQVCIRPFNSALFDELTTISLFPRYLLV